MHECLWSVGVSMLRGGQQPRRSGRIGNYHRKRLSESRAIMANPLVPDVSGDYRADTETPSDSDEEDRGPVVEVKPGAGFYFRWSDQRC